jgi:thiol:disulfide interchange protein
MNSEFNSAMIRHLSVLALVASLVGCEPAKSPNPSEKSADRADTAVQVQITDYAGLQELIASHRGKVVVVDVWSST